jgi:tetratricopeptide (TPR) repeat protein
MRTCTPLLLTLAGCAGVGTGSNLPSGVEAVSLLGGDLWRLEPTGQHRDHYEAELAAAQTRWEEAGLEQDAVWVGRNLAYLGRYQDSIEWYSDRLRDFPLSARLLRHRGHRYLSTRQVDLAIADLARAWSLLEGTQDQVEPDGAPNQYGIPRSTTHTNVLYHLGLAHYVKQDWTAAAASYDACLARCTNDDMRVATMNWLVHALRRAGRGQEAAEVLAQVSGHMEVLENHVYYRLLLLQKGEMIPDDVLGRPQDGVQDATALYGISAWSYCNGNHTRASALWRATVDRTPWNAFGHLCAEAELAR